MHGLISNSFLHFHAWIDIQQFLAQSINLLFLKYIIFLLRPALYVMLANIYASAGRWEEVATVRKLMRDNGLKKKPGCSWVEVNKRVHLSISLLGWYPHRFLPFEDVLALDWIDYVLLEGVEKSKRLGEWCPPALQFIVWGSYIGEVSSLLNEPSCPIRNVRP
ncbi:hypothetical protein RJ639_021379 [Escallonia herrerae]|uniref:Pentatricopeptide repeat-containing protein n=1 Tax=Escallonia herrerae TaxID=1293975 RepID=A0AA88V353_9ASTE|nr:hypothetical protein RJ639_021379 [Escallonia herrerae]